MGNLSVVHSAETVGETLSLVVHASAVASLGNGLAARAITGILGVAGVCSVPRMTNGSSAVRAYDGHPRGEMVPGSEGSGGEDGGCRAHVGLRRRGRGNRNQRMGVCARYERRSARIELESAIHTSAEECGEYIIGDERGDRTARIERAGSISFGGEIRITHICAGRLEIRGPKVSVGRSSYVGDEEKRRGSVGEVGKRGL